MICKEKNCNNFNRVLQGIRFCPECGTPVTETHSLSYEINDCIDPNSFILLYQMGGNRRAVFVNLNDVLNIGTSEACQIRINGSEATEIDAIVRVISESWIGLSRPGEAEAEAEAIYPIPLVIDVQGQELTIFRPQDCNGWLQPDSNLDAVMFDLAELPNPGSSIILYPGRPFIIGSDARCNLRINTPECPAIAAVFWLCGKRNVYVQILDNSEFAIEFDEVHEMAAKLTTPLSFTVSGIKLALKDSVAEFQQSELRQETRKAVASTPLSACPNEGEIIGFVRTNEIPTSSKRSRYNLAIIASLSLLLLFFAVISAAALYAFFYFKHGDIDQTPQNGMLTKLTSSPAAKPDDVGNNTETSSLTELPRPAAPIEAIGKSSSVTTAHIEALKPEKVVTVTGQVTFFTGRGRAEIANASIRVVKDAEFRAIASELINQIIDEDLKTNILIKQYEADEAVLRQAIESVKSLSSEYGTQQDKTLSVLYDASQKNLAVEIDAKLKLRHQILNFQPHYADDFNEIAEELYNRHSDLKRPEKNTNFLKSLIPKLPPVVTWTDPEGKFSVNITGSAWIIAMTPSVGGRNYVWAIRHDPELGEGPRQLLLSNNNVYQNVGPLSKQLGIDLSSRMEQMDVKKAPSQDAVDLATRTLEKAQKLSDQKMKELAEFATSTALAIGELHSENK